MDVVVMIAIIIIVSLACAINLGFTLHTSGVSMFSDQVHALKIVTTITPSH